MNNRVQANLDYAHRALKMNTELLEGYNWDLSDTGSERLRLELQGHRAELNKIVGILEQDVITTAAPSDDIKHGGYRIIGIENIDKLAPTNEKQPLTMRLQLESVGLPVNHSLWANIFMKDVPKLSIGVMVHSQVPALVLQMSLEDLEKHTYRRRIKRYVDMTNEIYIERCKERAAFRDEPPAKTESKPTVSEYRDRLHTLKFE